MTTVETGNLGETYAEQFLQEKGYRILARQFRARKGEIDLIALWQDRVMVFLEVKTRGDDLYQKPEAAVHGKKQSIIAETAGAYMLKTGHEGPVRFDIISILMKNGELREIRHLEDAFFPGL